MVLNAKVAIEFADELVVSPTWRASCQCLLPSLLRDTLSSRIVGRDQLLWNSMVQGTQRFRQVRAASCVIPYVLCGGLYCLRCRCVSRGSLPALIYPGGQGYLVREVLALHME